MAVGFTVENVESRIAAALQRQNELVGVDSSFLGCLKDSQMVYEWVFSQPSEFINRVLGVREATEKNVDLLNGLWELCSKHNIELETDEKVALYRAFLGD
jgi:hypothetical protein